MSEQRFQLMSEQEAFKAGVPGMEDDPDNYRAYLVEFHPDGTKKVIARDGGEPEDATFGRDFSGVIDALDSVAEEAARYRSAIENLPDPESDEEFDTDDLLRGVTAARKALLPK